MTRSVLPFGSVSHVTVNAATRTARAREMKTRARLTAALSAGLGGVGASQGARVRESENLRITHHSKQTWADPSRELDDVGSYRMRMRRFVQRLWQRASELDTLISWGSRLF